MKTLFIDTHYKDIRIALFEDGKLVDKYEVIDKKNNSEYIFPSIIKVIDGIKLDEIIVVTGPGSFTGVRLGVTIAKTFAYTLNIPIKTITSLECMAISCGNNTVGLDDGNGVFLGVFDDEFKPTDEYIYLNKEEFSKRYNNESVTISPDYDYEKIYAFVKKNKSPENPHGVKPIYVKKIGVEK